MTALQQACYRGNVEIAKLLISSGANVNWSQHKQGYTALMFAALVSCVATVEHSYKYIVGKARYRDVHSFMWRKNRGYQLPQANGR